ncbi:hypothetical protein O181_063304 [Austropuccinia psidii MF-1]|uniref:Uncharacterized protein n=1 Tax=Austropuccinia psidii MF-1 TaxID=1389203 RepID=A0A9Q3ELX0_9BASI|nr:hypothetical protein [Austropuccinia psidii MF-1]
MSDSSPDRTAQIITRSISRKLALYDLPIPPGLVSVAWPQSPASYSKPCLSLLPTEVKRIIIQYLQDFDRQEKIKQIGLRPREIELLDFDPCGLDLVKLDPPSFMFCYPPGVMPTSSSIKALASVDRSFYHLCQPWIWQFLDLDGLSNSQLEKLISVILPLHRHHVRSLWWRSSTSPCYCGDGSIQCHMKAQNIPYQVRNKLLLQIWRVCPRVIKLNADMSKEIIAALNPWGFELFKTPPRSSLFQPILRLSALTSLHLAPPAPFLTFEDKDLIPLLRETPNLTSFSCIRIRPSFSFDSHSGLGFQLASLAKLQNLTLSYVYWIDSSWAALDWKGPIRSFSLSNCLRLTLKAFHALVQRFSNTLERLQVENNLQTHYMTYDYLMNPLLIKPDDPTFDLPRLTHLIFPVDSKLVTVRLIPTFLGCKALQKVYVGTKPPVDYDELAKIFENVDKSPLHSFDIENSDDGFDYSDSIVDEDELYDEHDHLIEYSDSIWQGDEWY